MYFVESKYADFQHYAKIVENPCNYHLELDRLV